MRILSSAPLEAFSSAEISGADPSFPGPASARSWLGFESVWRASTFLLVVTTFAALIITRELDRVTLIAFPLCLAAAWLVRTPPRFWKSWMGFVLTIGVVLLLARHATREYFLSLLQLLLFLVIYKCFSLRSSRDYLQVQILCFFLLVATAVITVTYLFSFAFLVYVMFAVLGLGLYGIGRKGEMIARAGAGIKKGGSLSVLRGLGPVPIRFLPLSLVVAIAAFILVILFFYFLPHYALQKLDAPLSPNRMTPNMTVLTGFGEDVKLGDFKRIQPDGTVVMRVEIDRKSGTPPPAALRLRGVVLDVYENSRWRRNYSDRRGNSTNLLKGMEIDAKSALPSHSLHQRIYQNPNVTLRLFGATFPTRFGFDSDIWVRRDHRVSTYQATSPGKAGQFGFSDPFVYDVYSSVPEETAAFLRKHVQWERAHPNELFSRRFRLRRSDYFTNTQLSRTDLIGDIRELSRRVAPGPTTSERILQVLAYLGANYTYTLEPDTPDGEDPIQAFLFQTKKGHCEFFATALVLMLRTQGIPARIINGFYATDWNEGAGVFVVKQSDAHSWTEVWLDGVGWVTVDPTPPSRAGSGAYPNLEESLATPVSEYLRMWWQRNIIDYSAPKQAQIYSRIGQTAPFQILGKVGGTALGWFAKEDVTGATPGGELDPGTSVIFAFFLLVLVTGLTIFIFSRFRSRNAARGGPVRTGVDFFAALLRKLEKLGIKRDPSQTPREMVESIRGNVTPADQLPWIIDLYYAERFSGVPAKPEDRRAAMRTIEALSRPAPGPRA